MELVIGEAVGARLQLVRQVSELLHRDLVHGLVLELLITANGLPQLDGGSDLLVLAHLRQCLAYNSLLDLLAAQL